MTLHPSPKDPPIHMNILRQEVDHTSSFIKSLSFRDEALITNDYPPLKIGPIYVDILVEEETNNTSFKNTPNRNDVDLSPKMYLPL